MTSSLIEAIDLDHVSTEDHLAHPVGWDPLNYPEYDNLFASLGYRVRRITTTKKAFRRNMFNIAKFNIPTRTTPKYTGPPPSKTIMLKGDDYRIYTNSELRRIKQRLEERDKYRREHGLPEATSSEFPGSFSIPSDYLS